MRRILLCLLLGRHEKEGRFLDSPVDVLIYVCCRCGRVLP